ncbi:MAG: hypothetical protein JXA11_01755 [Phycisphaerae bacterium]|nr:hypothetical protein [Phycisphaerae bacterium]
MNPIKMFRKLMKAIRGGASSRQIFLGVFLGFAVGMTPGVNLTMILFLICLLILNTNGFFAGVSLILGKVLCLLLAPVTFHLGYAMIHSMGLSALVRALADTPVLALLDWQVYCVIGSLPFTILVGTALAIAATTAMKKVRLAVVAVQGDSEKLRVLTRKLWMRFLLWLAMGKGKSTVVEALKKKTPLFRKGRLIGGAVLVLVFVVLSILFLDSAVKSGIEGGAGFANGAEVNLDSASLSLTKGQLTLEGLQVTNRLKPEENRVQAKKIVADVSIAALLTRRLELDLISCDAMQLNIPREKPGDVYRQPTEEEKPKEGLLAKLPLGEAGKLQEYTDKVKNFNENLKKVREYLKGDGEKKQPDPEELKRRAEAEGYFALSAQDVLAKRPSWLIRQLEVLHVEIRPGLPTFNIEGKNLSSNPSLVEEPMSLQAKPDPQAVAKWKENFQKNGGLKGMLGNKKKESDKQESGETEKKEKKGLLDGLIKK